MVITRVGSKQCYRAAKRNSNSIIITFVGAGVGGSNSGGSSNSSNGSSIVAEQ